MHTMRLGRRIGCSGWVAAGTSLVCLLGLAAGTPARAAVESEPTIQGYALNLDDRRGKSQALIEAPLPVSIAVDGMIQKRDLAFDDFGVKRATLRRLGAYVGVDVTSWLTLRGLVGYSDFEVNVGDNGRIVADLEAGGAAEGRLLNWHMAPMLVNITWIHFDASARYLNALKGGSAKAGWQEGYGDLTVSLVVVPPANEETVRSLAVFAGPAVSWIDGRVDTAQGDSHFRQDQLVGYTGGIVVVPHDNITLKLAAQVFKDLSYEAALEFHF